MRSRVLTVGQQTNAKLHANNAYYTNYFPALPSQKKKKKKLWQLDYTAWKVHLTAIYRQTPTISKSTTGPRMTPEAIVHHGAELSGLPVSLVQKIVQEIWETKGTSITIRTYSSNMQREKVTTSRYRERKKTSRHSDVWKWWSDHLQRRYCRTLLLPEMYRMAQIACLPDRLSRELQFPIFSDKASEEKFWRRTGYRIHNRRQNYDRPKKILTSDPHPKRDRKILWIALSTIVTRMLLMVTIPIRQRGKKAPTEKLAASRIWNTSRRGTCNPKRAVQIIMNRSSWWIESGSIWKARWMWHSRPELRTILISWLVLNGLACHYTKASKLYKLSPFEQWDSHDGTGTDMTRKFLRMIIDAKVFRIFDVEEVPFYRRPAQYLTASMAAAGFNDKEAKIALDKLQIFPAILAPQMQWPSPI